MANQRLTNISVANIYREPRFGSETITQSLLGETLTVLDEQNDWYHVQQHDDYQGWVPGNFTADYRAGWDAGERFASRHQVAWIHESPTKESTALRDVTMGSALPILAREAGWVQVQLPDGLSGWMADEPRPLQPGQDVESMIATAMQFLGIQYLWGGRSPKGFDCSGFVQTVFALHGLQLPRDAFMQAAMGTVVDDDFSAWQAGDLIYFSERPNKITHVALSLGGGDFIHASGFVKLNSLSPQNSDLFIGKYADIFTKTMRIL